MLQMVSVCPAAAEYHEFKLFDAPDANGTPVPVESKAGRFESIDGVIEVPMGPDLGVDIDPEYVNLHKAVGLQGSSDQLVIARSEATRQSTAR